MTYNIDWRLMFKSVLNRMREAGESNEMGARWMATAANEAVEAALASHTSALAERDAEIAKLKAENKRFGRALELIASAVSWVLDEDLNRPVEVAMDEEEMANIARGALQPSEFPHA